MIIIVSNELREIIKMEYKICGKCKVSKLVGEFGKDKSRKYGIDNICKICDKEYSKKYNLANKDKRYEQYKKYRLVLPDSYVLELIKAQTSFPHNAEIPAELIEAKRLEIKIKRLLKEMKK